MNKKTPRASRAKKPLSASKRINVYPTTIKGRFRINIGPFAIDSHAWLGADENAPDVIRSLGNQKLVRRREEPKQTRNPLIKDPYAITRMASDWLDVLFDLAENGDIDAARLVAVTVKWNTQRLNVMAHARPELFRAAARECDQWPVLMSRHPALCEDHEALLGKLTLGYDLPYYFDGTSKWTKDAFGKIANSLLEYVWQGWAMKRDGRFDINTVTPDAITLPEFGIAH